MDSTNKNKDYSFNIPTNPLKKRKKSKSESDTLLANTATQGKGYYSFG